MSKQNTVQTKQRSAPGLTRSRNSLINRQNTLGSHLSVQREATTRDTDPSDPSALSVIREVLDSPGQPLDPATRFLMESHFGYDFSHVRVHSDEVAARSAEMLDAEAYATGRHIVFGGSQFFGKSPGQPRLLAHELAHVVQQATAPVSEVPIARGFSVSQPHGPLERAAEEAADSLPERAPVAEIKRRRGSVRLQPPGEHHILQRQKKKAPTPQQAAAQAKDAERKAAAWDLIELHITPELLTKFQEIGRVVAFDAQKSILKTFEPYDDEISTPDQTFLQIFLQGTGNVPQGEFLGFLGGAGAQGLQAAIGAMLDTNSVGVVKERARLIPEDVLAKNLRSDSPVYEQFEDGALADLRGEFESWWQAFPQSHDDPSKIRSFATALKQEARMRYGADSILGQKVRKNLQALIDRGLSPIRDELDDARRAVRRKRELRTAASVGVGVGLLAGGIIGGLAGGWAGAAIGGAIGGLALGGLALGGAALSQLLSPSPKSSKPQPDTTGPGDYPVPKPHREEMLA
jgi:hypothetical protein